MNAVWAAAADGVAVMDQRLIATSAVRCVGNTLLLQGRTYSPPFVITAIADADAVRAQLAASPQVAVLQQAVDAFGLTFDVRAAAQVTLPAYDGPAGPAVRRAATLSRHAAACDRAPGRVHLTACRR